MKINPDHLRKAEELLIGGEEFDEERREFIFCQDTIDLLAVPGSGKTTALLAKLYCIAQQMPLKDNAGILVLSHTNHAVEEIEKVLKPICPQLFSYPNFVGTIQSFANKFIANQACFELYGSYIRKNDDEMYFYEAERFYKKLPWNKNPPALGNKLFGIVNRGLEGDSTEKNKRVLDFLKNCSFDFESRKIKQGSRSKIIHNGANREYYLELEKWKIGLLSQGILSYRDSFDVANRYLENPSSAYIKSILQNRFKYVFIDEMQDLDKDQVDLIESIFFTMDSDTIIQRIGDKNQSIYSNSSLSSETIWKTRYEFDPARFPENLSLNKSHRLTETIGKLVDGFVLSRDVGYEVVGTSKNKNIAPYLLVYKDEADADLLKRKFIELIKQHQLEKNKRNVERGFHIIAWTTDKDEVSDKWHLRKLFPEFTRESKQKKEDFDCLRKYLFLFDRDKKTFESIRKSLLNGIIRILRIEQIYHDIEKRQYFGKSSFVQLVKSKGEDFYQSFKEQLFDWCYSIVVCRDYDKVYVEYCNYIKYNLVKLFPDFKIEKSRDFIVKQFPFIESEELVKDEREEYGLSLKLGSIHSVKGQTHCATMYVETDYHNCETHKLRVELRSGTKSREPIFANNPLYFQRQSISKKGSVRSNEALKMMYVGFSRPTHLLCFAVRLQNVKDDLDKYRESGWVVELIR